MSGRRRAFALPLVLLVVLISTLMLSLMLNRHNTQSLAVQRDLDRYTSHHIGKGLEEIIANWLRTFGSKTMPDMLDEQGVGIVLTPDDGAAVQVSFRDAQGAVLTDLSGLPPKARDLALDIISRVRPGPDLRDAEGRPLTRKYGPIALSANSAPEPVLRAAVEAALDLDPGSSNASSDSIVSGIVSLRGRPGRDRERAEPFPTGKLDEIFTRASVSAEAMERLRLVIVESPSLWSFVVEPVNPSSDPAVEPVRYEGFLLAGIVGRDRTTGGVQRTSPVLGLSRVREPAASFASGIGPGFGSAARSAPR